MAKIVRVFIVSITSSISVLLHFILRVIQLAKEISCCLFLFPEMQRVLFLLFLPSACCAGLRSANHLTTTHCYQSIQSILNKGSINQSIILPPTIVTSQSNQSCITSSRSIIWSPPTGNSRPNQSADTHCSCQFCIGLPILHRVASLHWFQLTLVPTANYLFQYLMTASVG